MRVNVLHTENVCVYVTVPYKVYITRGYTLRAVLIIQDSVYYTCITYGTACTNFI